VNDAGASPAVWPLYAVPGGEEIVAPYEDRAVRITVEGQIRACGCALAPSPTRPTSCSAS
jgi:hypothetical protein